MSSTTAKKLDCWEADFKTAAIKFKKMPGPECAPRGGKLVLGVKSWLSNIEDPFFGDWGIDTDGQLISHAYGLTGVDSRLQPPNNIKLQGPAGEKYNFVPVSRSYLNNYTDLPAVQHLGFANLAGKLDVPFFEDIKVQLQTGAKKTNGTDLIYLPGGWPDLANAWDVGGKHFFNTAPTDPPFDVANRGFEGAVSPPAEG